MDSDGERVPNMEAACDIGWGAGDHECSFGFRLSVGSHCGLEESLVEPPVIPSGLDGDGIVAVRHWGGEVCSEPGNIKGQIREKL